MFKTSTLIVTTDILNMYLYLSRKMVSKTVLFYKIAKNQIILTLLFNSYDISYKKIIFILSDYIILGQCPTNGEYCRSFVKIVLSNFKTIPSNSLIYWMLSILCSWKQFNNYLWRIDKTWISCLCGLLSNQQSVYLYCDTVVCWWPSCVIQTSITFLRYKSYRSKRYYFWLPTIIFFIADF